MAVPRAGLAATTLRGRRLGVRRNRAEGRVRAGSWGTGGGGQLGDSRFLIGDACTDRHDESRGGFRPEFIDACGILFIQFAAQSRIDDVPQHRVGGGARAHASMNTTRRAIALLGMCSAQSLQAAEVLRRNRACAERARE